MELSRVEAVGRVLVVFAAGLRSTVQRGLSQGVNGAAYDGHKPKL